MRPTAASFPAAGGSILPAGVTGRFRFPRTLFAPLRRSAPILRIAMLVVCGLSAAVRAAESGPFPPDADIVLWEPCTREQADRWAADAGVDGKAALRAACCYAALIRKGEEKSAGLADARNGRRAADAAVRGLPDSGMAHYMAAYLAGLEAERATLRGLSLVPVIEREARRAAELSPGVDRGGPDRMLGELYLRAPGFPLSVGDSRKAVVHYRRAVSHAPSDPENRIGLAEAFLSVNQRADACGELRRVTGLPAGSGGDEPVRRKAHELFERHCPRDTGE